MLPDTPFQIEIENSLHQLNYRWKAEALALWQGNPNASAPYRIYEGYEDVINLKTLKRIDKFTDENSKARLRFTLIDHFLRHILLPHETEMQAWSRGAAAQVEGHNIYFRDIIPWCQKSSTYPQRQILQKETVPLCKFLKPFAFNYWSILLETLRDKLGYKNYIDYCRHKKGIDYAGYYKRFQKLLKQTDAIYFPAMEKWSHDTYGLPLKDLTRFDAINLLGLGQFDNLFPNRSLESMTAFFHLWEIDIAHTSGLILDLGKEAQKSAQAMCFVLNVPQEVYVLMRPEGGWVDLETLWHELGHGLSAVYSSAELSLIDRDMPTSYSLSEAYAFLLQNLTLSRSFLEDYLGLASETAQKLYYYKILKELSGFRRYAAKFLAEFNMFSSGDISNGEPYAGLMARYTGFYYQPESHLFDLVPEFYCLDYLLGWMGEAIMESYLREQLGPDWMLKVEAGRILKKWWARGNQFDIFEFFERNDLGPLRLDPLIQRWQTVLN
jgi:hypothetical protein